MIGAVVGLLLLVAETTPSPTPEVVQWAEQTNIDPQDLQGAVNTTGLSPEDYLITIGVVQPTTPRDYLYRTYPSIAPRLDCVIEQESHWSAGATNPRSGAAGLIQALPSTWSNIIPATVRQGRSIHDPIASIDGGAWLARNVGWTQWEVVTRGMC